MNNKKLKPLSNKTVLGALTNYITNEKISSLKPMKCNLGILDQDNKNSQEQFYSYNNSSKELTQYLNQLNEIMKINIG
ncbi:hypothetical protein JIY74_28105 [Vibrio harveyi]|nr:hypothetical protein [Vibrio harveyi]